MTQNERIQLRLLAYDALMKGWESSGVSYEQASLETYDEVKGMSDQKLRNYIQGEKKQTASERRNAVKAALRRAARRDANESAGLKRVRGSLGGVYWE